MTARATLPVPALALLLAGAWPTPAEADTVRVKTARGTFLVELDAPGLEARAEGDDLVISRPGGDEIRLRPDADPAARAPREPLLTIGPPGRPTLTVRRAASSPASPTAPGPGRTALGGVKAGAAWSLAITPDGRTLAAGHQGSLRVWDLATRAERLTIPTGKTVRRVALTPDGATIATVEYDFVDGKPSGSVVIRDGKTGEARRTTKPIGTGLHAVALDPEGKVAVSSSWGEAEIHVWDAASGERVGTLKGHTGPVGTVAYSPDGRSLASCGDTTVRLWDVDTGAARKVLRGHQKGVESVAFAADGKTLASGGFDDTARVWEAATGKPLATVEADHPILAVALSPDGKALATASARWGDGFYGAAPAEVQIWEAATGRPIATLPEQPNQVFGLAFTPDGQSLITASLSGAVTIWDLASFRDDADRPK